ncbi:MAG: BTAD domain-containing putative transcriptional regulator [Caldimonas sp.]
MGDAALALLGLPRLVIGADEVRFPDRRCIALLALLALDGRSTRARIAALLWDEQSDADARRNLRRELHRMREAGMDPVLVAEGDALSLRDDVRIDTSTFAIVCAGFDPAAALLLYGGGLLPGFELGAAPAFNDWLSARRETLAQHWRTIADRHCAALEDGGDLRGALVLATRLIAEDQLQEGHYRRAMALHARLGEREAALDAYERCRKALGRELGLRPLAPTTELAERIRAGTLPLPVPRVPAVRTLVLSPAEPAFVGRKALLAELHEALRTHRLVLLDGPAGIGKSRLLRVVAAGRSDIGLHDTRMGDAQVPFAALARWLRTAATQPARTAWPLWVAAELARLLPELGTPAQPAASEVERLRLFEAARIGLASGYPAAQVHVFDDFQFVDEASAQWWRWWLEQETPAMATLVATRPTPSGTGSGRALREATLRHRAAEITVEALDEEAVFELVRQLSGTDRPERFARRLWKATAGNPLFAIETLAHLVDRGIVRIDERGRWHTPYDEATHDYRELPIPRSVQAAIAARVEGLGDAAQRLLEAASLIGDDFDIALASGATALGEWEALQALESALQARIVQRASRPGFYRFEHDLFAHAIQSGLSAERRQLVHRALGARLAQGESAPARVAEHYEQGGDVDAARRWRLLALAAAQRSGAVHGVTAEADRILALHPGAAQAITAHLARAEAFGQQAEPALAAEALRAARACLSDTAGLQMHVDVLAAEAAFAARSNSPATVLESLGAWLIDPRLTPAQRVRLLGARAGCLKTLGQIAESRADLETALDVIGTEPSVERGDLLDWLARGAALQGRFDDARRHAEAAAEVFRALGHAAGLAAALTMTGMVALMTGRMDEALRDLHAARDGAHRAGVIGRERGAILNLVPALHVLGEYDAAASLLEEGYQLSRLFSSSAEQQGFLEARFVCRLIAGQLDGALDARAELVAFGASIGDRHRQLSGLLVAADMPLLLGDSATAAETLGTALALIDSGEVDVLAVPARAKAAWLALLAGDTARARRHIDAALPLSGHSRPDDQLLLQAMNALTHVAEGEAAAALAALCADRAGATPELWSVHLVARVEAESAAGGVSAATLAEASAELEGGKVPPLNALELANALAKAGVDTTFSRDARETAARLRANLVRHPREADLFERRFGRWLAPG